MSHPLKANSRWRSGHPNAWIAVETVDGREESGRCVLMDNPNSTNCAFYCVHLPYVSVLPDIEVCVVLVSVLALDQLEPGTNTIADIAVNARIGGAGCG
jgi:hypothetical protein